VLAHDKCAFPEIKKPRQVKTAMTVRPSVTPARNGPLQRKCACGGTLGADGLCEKCRKKRL
jgi:hypothetical protein